MIAHCEWCGKEFKTIPSLIKIGKGRFCSKNCFYAAPSRKIILSQDHALVPLSKGKFVKIDLDDVEKVKPYTWSYSNPNLTKEYAITQIKGTSRFEYLHRFIMDADSNTEVDHRDGDGLNCRRSNMRICTSGQNSMNSKKRENTSSHFKGVCWAKNRNKWLAYIAKNHKTYWLGYFLTETDAAKAYNLKAKELFGDFARLNTLD